MKRKRLPPGHDLVYKLNDNPSFTEKVLAAFQHICAIIIPIMMPGYILIRR